MRLSRVIMRTLGDGRTLSVHREWQIQFFEQGRGFTVSGTQTLAKVDAPKNLAAIARIEEERSTDQMWPILLAADGRILGTGDFTRKADLTAAVQAAEESVLRQDQSPSIKAQHMRYLSQMQQASSSLLDTLPPDLFFPVGEPQNLVRAIDLPEGMKGEFEISYSAKPASGGQWLSEAKREITTRIGNDIRRSTEEWRLIVI
ncbi:hypothetical protein [Erythrobacter crassostreae]|uniref:Uncharacterized protein n=1 Tax=Erythrobacter crassostreae TaxID=2828328 RepID=A0A9X1F3E9_9SPHN|nr:hypothetical protein [Erythrobacter crassostrea]MBV7258603.1 hypothetical protein [Erythrobacter crassostrea]